MIELIIALIVGILIGTLTGLTPGLHINLLIPFLLSLSFSSSSFFSPLLLVVFIVSLSITHVFLDFIPSIFLGAPNEDTNLSILPGHSLLLQGKAHEAVILCLSGSLLGIFLSLLITPFFIFAMPLLYSYLKPVMFLVLIFTVSYLAFREENKFFSLVIFLLSGFLGIVAFSLPVKNSLLPLLAGLFGSSSLIVSLKQKNQIPKQKIRKLKEIIPEKSQIKNTFLASILSAPLCTFLPALGSNQAAVIASDIIDEKKEKSFLFLIGSINSIVMTLSFVVFFSINKTRTGSAFFIKEIVQKLNLSALALILISVLITGIFAFFLAVKISKIFAKNISKINYRKISLVVLIFISFLVFIFSSILGFLLFIVSTFTGLSCILLNLRRTSLMGSLMLTSILLYLPFLTLN